VLQRSGATVWLADLLVPVIEQAPYWLTLLVVVYASALLTNLLNNTTIAAVFVPILIAIAQGHPEITAVQLVLPVTLATTFGYSLPSASGRMSLIAASGIVGRKPMLGYGLVVTLASSGVLAIFFYVLTRLGLV
jgi:sodium-dependent dicarboxylate transporter 2/3/5